MKIVINLLLLLLIAGLGYLIFNSIQEPIKFESTYQKRKAAVAKQLEKIRTSQEIYKSITGKYSNNFADLKSTLQSGNMPIYKIVGDIDDENVEAVIDTLYVPAVDTLRGLGVLSIDSLDHVPYGNSGAKYFIDADTMTYQSTLVNVVEVGIRYGDFMGKFDNPKYQRYNNMYDPNGIMKFGDMNNPNTSGNWR